MAVASAEPLPALEPGALMLATGRLGSLVGLAWGQVGP